MEPFRAALPTIGVHAQDRADRVPRHQPQGRTHRVPGEDGADDDESQAAELLPQLDPSEREHAPFALERRDADVPRRLEERSQGQQRRAGHDPAAVLVEHSREPRLGTTDQVRTPTPIATAASARLRRRKTPIEPGSVPSGSPPRTAPAIRIVATGASPRFRKNQRSAYMPPAM